MTLRLGLIAAFASLALLTSPAIAYHDSYQNGPGGPLIVSSPGSPILDGTFDEIPRAGFYEWNFGHHPTANEAASALYPGGPLEPNGCGGLGFGATGWYQFYFPRPATLFVKAKAATGSNDVDSNPGTETADGFDATLALFATSSSGATTLAEGVCSASYGRFDEELLVRDVGYAGASYYRLQVGGQLWEDPPGSFYYEEDNFVLRYGVVYDDDGDHVWNLTPDRCPNEVGDIKDGAEAGCPSDRDKDGYGRSPYGADCNDQNRAINPGARDIPHNGVNEDCKDGDNKDGDGDGFAAGIDCNDRNPGISPKAKEVKGDFEDENCDGKSPPSNLKPSPVVTVRNAAARGGAAFSGRIKVTNVVRGFRIVVRCRGRGRGCKRSRQKVVKGNQRQVSLPGPKFLRAGGRLEILITSTRAGQNRIGEYTRYKARRRGKPKRTDLCLYPGSKKPRKC